MTKYKLQYWLYAIMNKQFGKEVKFDRCSLHRIYEVNRHSFEVSTNTINISLVRSWLIKKLQEAKYEERDGYYIKLDNKKEYCVVVDSQRQGNGLNSRNKPVLSINIQSYSRR